MSLPYSQQHKQLITQSIITITEVPSYTSTQPVNEYTNYSLTVAITKYIATGTQLQSYSIPMISSGNKGVDASTNDTVSRLMNDMIINGMGTLSYYTGNLANYTYSDVSDEYNSKYYVFQIILIIDPIIIVLLLTLFIPFILKVQSTLQKIYLHICQFNEKNIKHWLDDCNNSAADIKASITRMQTIYQNETFEINPSDYEKKDNPKNDNIPKTGRVLEPGQTDTNKPKETTQNPMISTDNKNKEDDEEQTVMIVPALENDISERKQKAFSQMSKEKTKTYLIYLAIFVAYIAVFKIVDGVLLLSLSSSVNMHLSTMYLFYRRFWDQDKCREYFRENMVYNKVFSDFESNNNMLIFRC